MTCTFHLRRRARRALREFAFALLVMGVVSSASTQVLVVREVLPDTRESPFYRNVAAELQAQLATVRDGRLAVDVVSRERFVAGGTAMLAGRELVVAIGYGSCAAAIEQIKAIKQPPATLCLAIPQGSFQSLAGRSAEGPDRRVSAVFIGQPISRQLDLLQRALPGRTQVGVVYGPGDEEAAHELRENAAARSLTLHTVVVDTATEMFTAMQKVLAESNVFLALPNATTINDSTAYGVLRTSYSARVPVFGFSESMVRAGALLGLFTTARQYGRQGGEIARRLLTKEAGLPPPEWPRYFTVAVNQSVARSLGLHVSSEDELAASLAQVPPASEAAGARKPQ